VSVFKYKSCFSFRDLIADPMEEVPAEAPQAKRKVTKSRVSKRVKVETPQQEDVSYSQFQVSEFPSQMYEPELPVEQPNFYQVQFQEPESFYFPYQNQVLFNPGYYQQDTFYPYQC
jgi:hypothetical protein